MQNYDNSTVKDRRITAPPASPPTRMTQYVYGTFSYGIYDVTYSNTHIPGLISYTPTINPERAVMVAAIGVCIVATAFFPSLAPVLAGAVLSIA